MLEIRNLPHEKGKPSIGNKIAARFCWGYSGANGNHTHGGKYQGKSSPDISMVEHVPPTRLLRFNRKFLFSKHVR